MKTLLIVTEFYPPCIQFASPTRRMEGFVRYLPEFGWRPIVLNRQCSCLSANIISSGGENVDELMAPQHDNKVWLNELKHSLNQRRSLVIRIRCRANKDYNFFRYLSYATGSRFDDRHAMDEPLLKEVEFKKSLLFTGLSLVLQILRKMSALWMLWKTDPTDWENESLRFAKHIAAMTQVDAVLSSFPPIVHHRIGYRIAKKLQVPWVADFRDSINRWLNGMPRAVLHFNGGFLKKASLTSYVTPQEASRDKSFQSIRTSIIENGFLEEDILQAKKKVLINKDLFVIRYLGSANSDQDTINKFYDGFKLFLNQTNMNPRKIKFEYYGQSWKKREAEARDPDFKGTVTSYETCEKQTALQLMASANVLLLLILPEFEGCPGGKLYEYLGVEKPILAVGWKETYVKNVLKRTKSGVIASSPTEIANTLRAWSDEYFKTGTIYCGFDHVEIMKYSRRKKTEDLARELDRIVTRSN